MGRLPNQERMPSFGLTYWSEVKASLLEPQIRRKISVRLQAGYTVSYVHS